jgi:hypothetical protein
MAGGRQHFSIWCYADQIIEVDEKMTASPRVTPITGEDLRAYIDSQDDFAFEREVFHRANGMGLEAVHAGLYEDPVTNKPRQFDIRASKTVNDLQVRVTIECKGLSPTYPLLVSCVPRAAPESAHDVLFRSDVASAGGRFTRVSNIARSAAYPAGERVGKAMRQVKRDSRGELTGGDEVFDKWMQALASAAELVELSARDLAAPRGAVNHVAVLPILVVSDATLWVADHGSNGKLAGQPSQVTEVTFYLGRKYPMAREGTVFTISHLHIYTRSHIHTMFEHLTGGGTIWPQLFPASG